MHKHTIVSLLLLILSGCAVGPDYEKPKLSIADTFQNLDNYEVDNTSALMSWQQAYQDPVLQQLISTALTHNYDLAIAISRIKEANALANIADSSFYPSIGLLAQNKRISQGNNNEFDDTQELKGQLSWQLDLFGYNQRASEAAWAELVVLGQARHVVEMNLVAEVATTYFALLDLQEKN
jgi:outer membrane protein TolC